MQKTVLITFMSILFLNVYSQNTSNSTLDGIKTEYNNKKTTDDKLDFIFNQIIAKQISDYKKLENDHARLKKEQKNKFEYQISELQKKIENKDLRINILSNAKDELYNFKQNEKSSIENQINEIFKSNEIISENLLNIIVNRAKEYNIDGKKINKLKTFIDYSNTIRDAENLLADKYNESKINSQLKILRNLNTSKFNLKNKIISSILLLESYCDKSQYLYDTFKKIDRVRAGVSSEDLKYELQTEINLYTSFPYLLKEINKKIKNLDYKGSIQECF